MRNHSKHFYSVITTHSIRSKSRMCCYFYSLSKILLTYCMYMIVNKATFMTNENINEYITNNINFINTTSLSDSKLSSKVATQLLISFSIEITI